MGLAVPQPALGSCLQPGEADLALRRG